jgi:hypothetical protein
MITQKDITEWLRRLIYLRRRLAVLLEQKAISGFHIIPEKSIEIDEIRTHIRNTKQNLHKCGIKVSDHPDDIDNNGIELEFGADQAMVRRSGITPIGNPIPSPLRDVQVDRISALRYLMDQIPEMRDVVVSCHTALRSASKHLQELHGYKSLHDILHTIQRQCYDQIKTTSQKFFLNGEADDQLDKHINELRDFIYEIEEIINKYNHLEEITSWLPRINHACTIMYNSFINPNHEHFNQAFSQVGFIVKVYPSKIHQKLSESAHKMDVEILIAGMSNIYENLIKLRVDDNIINSFTNDIFQLNSLMELIDKHGRWQTIDADISLFEHSINQDDFILLWDMIKERTESLYATSNEEWANFLRRRAMQLEQAINQHDQLSIARHIQSYRWQASRQFYNVDGQLKDLCQKLDGSEGMLNVMRGVLA